MESNVVGTVRSVLKHKLVLFFLVSGINTVFGYGLFALFLFLGLTYSIALLISTIAGVLFNFKTIGGLVFKTHNNRLILKFFGVYAITYSCNLAGLYVLTGLGMNAYASGAILAIPIGLLSFLLNKKIVFNRKESGHETR